MQLAVVGLGTMGANIARNAARNGAKVPVYNRTTETMEQFMKDYASEGDFVACKSYEEIKAAMEPPRAVLIMVKAGTAVDAVIADLLEHLEPGDIIIDGGNSHYPDTERRYKELQEKGIGFLGMGVSGGEEGALMGPSMMPGGDKKAWETMEPLLTKMAADDGAGGKCVAYIGEGGSGHFVKMVHNGIEYGVMQLIAESYDVLKNIGGMTNEQLAETYGAWNENGFLRSFLVEITAKIFAKKDPDTDADLIDMIVDRAGQKGTGKWTTFAAMDYGVAIPTINAAVDARIISGSTDLRKHGKAMPHVTDVQEPAPRPQQLRSMVRNALKQSIITSYNQGFTLMKVASHEHEWSVDLSECARIWRGGCIIRSDLLPEYQHAFSSDSAAAKAAHDEIISRFQGEKQTNWRQVVELGVARGISLPAMSASLMYFDSLQRDKLPQSLVQAQRDFFGAHTFERTDKDGKFHVEWEE